MDLDYEGDVVHQGWLTKSPPLENRKQLFNQSLIQPKWRRRWFVLRQGTMPGQFVLQYYVDSQARKLKGTIDLDQCEQVDSGLTFECGKIRFQFMFDIKTPRRVFYLAAEGEEEMNTWVDLVCRVCGLHNFTSEGGEGEKQEGGVQEGSVVTRQPSISGPYMHLSECFTGSQSQPAQVRSRSRVHSSSSSSTTNRQTTTTTNTSSYDDSVQCGDDSVFLPNSPASKLSQLSLCPGRPPKPPSLRLENYENQQEVLNTKVETNNNCDNSAESPSFHPPCIDRRLKPERMAGSAGPPVERGRKPRQVTDTSNTFPGFSMAGEEEDSEQEQIYFYMPSLNTCSTPGFNTKWDPILIPAKELTENAVQYLDLDLAPGDTSFSDLPMTDRSNTRLRTGGGETVYKTVDFIKTEAFNRTRQKVEEYKYNIKQDK